jgi:hypothetical protein
MPAGKSRPPPTCPPLFRGRDVAEPPVFHHRPVLQFRRCRIGSLPLKEGVTILVGR